MPVVTLTPEAWEETGGRKTKWDAEMEALAKGEIVFVPLNGRRSDTLRITLYEAGKRVGLALSVRAYKHDGTDGYAVKVRP